MDLWDLNDDDDDQEEEEVVVVVQNDVPVEQGAGPASVGEVVATVMEVVAQDVHFHSGEPTAYLFRHALSLLEEEEEVPHHSSQRHRVKRLTSSPLS